jgi:hypothetical protein
LVHSVPAPSSSFLKMFLMPGGMLESQFIT